MLHVTVTGLRAASRLDLTNPLIAAIAILSSGVVETEQTGNRGFTIGHIVRPLGDEAPDIAFPRIEAIDLIDSPVVGGIRSHCAGVKGRARLVTFELGRGVVCIAHSRNVGAEVHIVRNRITSRRPAKVRNRWHIRDSVSRVRCPGKL